MRVSRILAVLLFLGPLALAARPALAEDLFLLRSSGLAMLDGVAEPVRFDQAFVFYSGGGAADTIKRLTDKGFGFVDTGSGRDLGPGDGRGPTVLFAQASMGTVSEDGTFRLEFLVETLSAGRPGKSRDRRGMALLTVEKTTPIDDWLMWTFEGDIEGTAVTAGHLRPLHDRVQLR